MINPIATVFLDSNFFEQIEVNAPNVHDFMLTYCENRELDLEKVSINLYDRKSWILFLKESEENDCRFTITSSAIEMHSPEMVEVVREVSIDWTCEENLIDYFSSDEIVKINENLDYLNSLKSLSYFNEEDMPHVIEEKFKEVTVNELNYVFVKSINGQALEIGV